jgi:3-oxoadipate enol-lactonase
MSIQNVPDRYLECDGAHLRWRLEGRGPAIALLHGWALDLEYWDPVAARLALQFTVLRFDRRGFGLSSGAPDTARDHADLLALFAAAGIVRPALLGMSQGARLAMRFALLHPEALGALILDGAPSLEDGPELPLAEYRACLQAEGPAAMRAAIRQHPLMRLHSADAHAQRLLGSVLVRYQGSDLLQHAVAGPDLDLPRIDARTLIMTGSLDTPARLAAGARLAATIPGARQVQLPGAGHLAALDDPARYAQIVAAFCTTAVMAGSPDTLDAPA